MTMTVKLDPLLEQRLRERSATLGRPASELIREALQAYLADVPATVPSAYVLGADLFGRHAGAADLAAERKRAASYVWEQKHADKRP